MIRYFASVCFAILTISSAYSQNKIRFYFSYGYFLHNSENSMRIMGNSEFRSHLSYGVSFSKANILGLNFSLDYNYSESIKNNTLMFYRTAPDNSTPISSYGSDVSLLMHSLNLNYYTDITSYLIAGIGPSLLFMSRIIEIEITPSGEERGNSIYDKLASACIGGNVFMEFTLPLNNAEKYFFLSSKLRAVYAHSFWFDEKGRNLANYKQEFLDTQISIGVGYSF